MPENTNEHCAMDTAVVVLAVVAVSKLNIEKVWVTFCSGKRFHFLTAHEVAAVGA